MEGFICHTAATAPAGAAEVLAKVRERYGFVPNLAAVVAESPIALEAILSLSAAFERSSLSAAEQQLVLLAASVRNECGYCRTVHTALGRRAGLDDACIRATLADAPLADPRLAALRDLTAGLVERRGRVDEAGIRRFLAAGYTRAQVLEVVMGVALKTFTNYCNHLAGAEPNAEFVAMAG